MWSGILWQFEQVACRLWCQDSWCNRQHIGDTTPETGLLHALSKWPQTEESAARETTRQTQLSRHRVMKKTGRSHTETHQAHVEGQLDCIFSVPMQHSFGFKLGERLKRLRRDVLPVHCFSRSTLSNRSGTLLKATVLLGLNMSTIYRVCITKDRGIMTYMSERVCLCEFIPVFTNRLAVYRGQRAKTKSEISCYKSAFILCRVRNDV